MRVNYITLHAMSLIPPAKIQHAINNVFVRCDACLHAAGKQFQTPFFFNVVSMNLT